MFLCDAMANRQPQTRSVFLAGGERLENPFEDRLWNTISRVGYDDSANPADIIVRLDPNNQRPSLRHCFNSIQKQIDKYLVELLGITVYDDGSARHILDNFNTLLFCPSVH